MRRGALLAAVLVVGFVGVALDDDAPGDAPGQSARGQSADGTGDGGRRAEPTVAKERKAERDRRGRQREAPERADKPTRKSVRKPSKKPSTSLVTRIVDGDTLELGNGQTVRLVGIDTPEVGECGFEAASDALAGLVLGRQVRLTISDEDTDQYGRLLRYVDVGTTDAGLRLVKRGLASARYDSRDGYGYHPRERHYVAADAASDDVGCPKPATLVGGGGGGGGNCAPGYTPCIPPYPPDLDCGDLSGPIQVRGSDPHGLDADGDGVACES